MKPELFYKILSGILLSIVAFVGAQLYMKICDMTTTLEETKIEIVKINANMIGRDEIKDICRTEIMKYHSVHHGESQ